MIEIETLHYTKLNRDHLLSTLNSYIKLYTFQL